MTESASTILHFAHNTDLDPGEAYLAQVPRVRAVLSNGEMLGTFAKYDPLAIGKQRLLWRLGIASLSLGTLALIGMVAKLLVLALEHDYTAQLERLTFASEVCAVISILLAILPFFGSTRRQWLTARFMAERIRQWHFQALLDGALIARSKSSPKAFEAERARRWASVLSIAPSAEGALNAFVDAQDLELFHAATESGDGKTDDEICRVYRELRFNKQQAYFQHKREAFAAKDEWSEGIAKWTLFSALVLAAVQLIVMWMQHGNPHASHDAGIWMSAAALWLVAISLAVRVYRNAIGITEQRERYESKFVRLVALRAAFESSPTMSAKRAVMQDVERLLIEELREFLRQSRKSSFVF